MISFEDLIRKDLIRKCGLKKEQACSLAKIIKQKQTPIEKQNKAKNAIAKAIRKGKIKRPPTCHACFIKCKPVAHHPDYDKLFLVQWLCRSCHIKTHKCYLKS